MIPRSRLLRNPQLRASVSARWFASSAAQDGGRSAQCRYAQSFSAHSAIQNSLHFHSPPPFLTLLKPFPTGYLPQRAFSTTLTPKAISFRDLQGEGEKKPKAPPDPISTGDRPPGAAPEDVGSTSAHRDPDDPAEQAYQAAKAESDREQGKAKARADRARAKAEKDEASDDGGEEPSERDQRQEKKQEEAPPPPHGNKSPIQVFMDTMKKEFQASKEWNEGTKQLASSAHQFSENESVKRARAAYSAASGAATSGTASALKGAAKTVGQGAAWTWDTTVVKGVRQGVNATGRAIDTATKPVRETQAFKSVRDVIDDGSSSKYGGWVEKEERRKQRELREIQEAAASGRPGRRAEKIEEDPE